MLHVKSRVQVVQAHKSGKPLTMLVDGMNIGSTNRANFSSSWQF